jgi:hypothetical protein
MLLVARVSFGPPKGFCSSIHRIEASLDLHGRSAGGTSKCKRECTNAGRYHSGLVVHELHAYFHIGARQWWWVGSESQAPRESHRQQEVRPEATMSLGIDEQSRNARKLCMSVSMSFYGVGFGEALHRLLLPLLPVPPFYAGDGDPTLADPDWRVP